MNLYKEEIVDHTEFSCLKIKDEGVDHEIAEPSINQNVDRLEYPTGDLKLQLQCKVEIPDIREMLYCYECGEWSLTADKLLCHKLNHSEFLIDEEKNFVELFTKIYLASDLENFQLKNQHLYPHDDATPPGIQTKYSISNNTFQCDLCEKSFSKKYSLNIHKSVHRIKPFACEMCGASFDTERACAIHVLKHADIQPHDTSGTLQIKREREFSEESGLGLASESLINGVQILANEKLSIKDMQLLPCKVEISDIRDDLYCYECKEWCISANHLLYHKLKIHCISDYNEDFEQFQAQNQQVLSTGPNKIYDESVFEKFIEDNQYFNPRDYETQKQNKVDKKNIKIIAKSQGIKQNGKRRFYKIRDQFKIFSCDVCDKSFTNNYLLNIHKGEHIVKPFSCEMCSSSFDNEQACAIHVLKHAGIQPQHYHTAGEQQIKREKESQEELYDSISEQFQEDTQHRSHDKSQKENQNVKSIYYYEVDESVFEQFQEENQQIHYYEEEHDKKGFVCDYCRKGFSNKRNLMRHILNRCCTDRIGRNKKHTHKNRKKQAVNKMFPCDLCNKRLATKYTLEVHKCIHKTKPFSCEICGYLFNTERACAIHELKHAIEKVEEQSCHVCGRVLKSKEFDKHMKSHTNKMNPSYFCELCGKKFSKKSCLVKHIENKCVRKTRVSRDRRGLFPCNLCNRSCSRQWCLDVHKRNHKIKPFTCEICDKMFDNEKACKIHELKHAGIKPHQCDQCEKSFFYESLLKEHKGTHRGVKLYSCDTCNTRFRYKGNLSAHNKMFHNISKQPPRATCDICGKTFRCKKYVVKHIERHGDKKPFQCEHCHRPFRLAQELESHILNIHTALRPFECKQCAKRFASKYSLASHEHLHDDKYRKYPCDVCGMKFSSKKYQVVHTLRHQGIRNKQYSCKTCGREFEDPNSLKRHQVLHSDLRPYPCEICGWCSKTKNSLTIHQLKHTKARPFTCDICGSRHRTFGERTHHMKIHNDNEHWCDYCGNKFTCKESVARHILGYCKKSRQKRIRTKKLRVKL